MIGGRRADITAEPFPIVEPDYHQVTGFENAVKQLTAT
jgi:hypothetical protein